MNPLPLLIVASWTIFLVIAPVFLPLFLLSSLLHWTVVGLSKILRPDLKYPISGLDLNFCADDFWGAPQGANAFVWELRNPLDVPWLKQKISGILSAHDKAYERLTKLCPTVWWGFPFWGQTPQKFNLDYHIREICFDGKSADADREYPLICQWMQHPFARERPLWDILVVNQEAHPSLFIFRIHHIVGDGISMLNFLEKLTKATLSDVPAQNHGPSRSSRKCPKWEHLAYIPLVFTRQFRQLSARAAFTSSDHDKKGWELFSGSVPLDDFKVLRRTFKDVPFASTAACILLVRNLLIRFASETPPTHWNIVVSLPSIGRREANRAFLNLWTHAIFELPPNQNSSNSPSEEIARSCQSVAACKFPEVTPWFLPMLNSLPFALIHRMVREPLGAPIGLTNVPGPDQIVALNGNPVLRKIGLAGFQWPQAAMSWSFFSYNGNLSVTLLIKKGLVDIESSPNFQERLLEEMQTLIASQ